jgi:hypothetical protein
MLDLGRFTKYNTAIVNSDGRCYATRRKHVSIATTLYTTQQNCCWLGCFCVVRAAVVAMQRRCEHVSAVTNQHAVIMGLLQVCFLCG